MSQAPDLVTATSGNAAFSRQLPGLQLAVDSTSLGEFKICPRRYYYNIVLGYQPRAESVHLTFGLLLHGARERYEHAKSQGQDHQTALRVALLWTLRSTWNSQLGRGWVSDHKTKNRLTLVRTVVWMLDNWENDPLQTVVLANGKPAVELSFAFRPGWLVHITGEAYTLCGHLDRIAQMAEVEYIVDVKSTEHIIDAGFFSKFSPDNQFSMYILAGRVAFQQPVHSLVVDAAQVGVTFSRFQRGIVQRDDHQVDEWLRDTRDYLVEMEGCARDGYWRQNDKSCGIYGGCQFRSVCSRSPVARQQWLDADFTRRVWDPTVKRGDI